jgi:hypothetical protein
MKRTFCFICVLAALALPAMAQLPLSFGLRGGARLTDFTNTSGDLATGAVTSDDHVYTIGPYAELHLPLGFSLQGELLYTKSGSTLITVTENALSNARQFNFDSFQLPVLLKKRFGPKGNAFHPFVEAGLANRYSTGLPGTTIGSSTTSGWQEGIVLGAGADVKLLLLRLSGELRWTRYGNISTQTVPRLNSNQADLLFGVGF